MRWKVAHSEGVTVLNGKWIDPNRSHAVGDVRLRVVWQIKPAQLRLDGDLPGTGRGKEEFICWILERPDLPAQSFRLRQQPKEDVRVEEKPHAQFSKVVRTLSSSGASKSSGMTKRPRSTPKARGAPMEGATRRAAGSPRRVMRISSPAATSSNNRDRCVLASWTPTDLVIRLSLFQQASSRLGHQPPPVLAPSVVRGRGHPSIRRSASPDAADLSTCVLGERTVVPYLVPNQRCRE